MPSCLPYLSLVIAAASVLDTSPAHANPEVRDHRTGVQPSIDQGPRYRRRPGPRFMLPLKIDIGASGANTSRGFAPGVAAAIGVHWASLSPRPTNFDIGVGVFGAVLSAPEDSSVMDDDASVTYGGTYLELGHTLSRGSFWRTWATGRGEYVGSSAFGATDVGFGAAGRLSAELFLSGVGIEPRGVFLGTYAIGVYVEAGVRDTVADLGKFHAGAGLTFRTPLVFAP